MSFSTWRLVHFGEWLWMFRAKFIFEFTSYWLHHWCKVQNISEYRSSFKHLWLQHLCGWTITCTGQWYLMISLTHPWVYISMTTSSVQSSEDWYTPQNGYPTTYCYGKTIWQPIARYSLYCFPYHATHHRTRSGPRWTNFRTFFFWRTSVNF